MTILFYSPFNQRSRDTESLMLAFKTQGHRILSLSQAEGNFIHPFLQSKEIETFSHVILGKKGILYYLRQIIYFITFCKRHEVDVVYAHLESANFVAAIGQYFLRAKVFICRHHIDEASLQGFNKSIYYKLTYKLAKKIIVVSSRAVEFMVNYERINRSKIIKINLAYDFTIYAKPNPNVVDEIKEKVSADLVLLTACRYTKYKRADLSIRVLKKLIDQGINAKLILLGRGEEELNLKKLINKLKLTDRVIMPGYANNITDYLAASDFLLHPSVLESSCVIVKEAAITNVPVIVCNDVGDFNDYLVHEKNSFVLAKDSEKFVREAHQVIVENLCQQEKLRVLAENLKTEVFKLFGTDNVINQYDLLMKKFN